jgi:hypothetical protein
MIKSSSRRREGMLCRLGESVVEIAAAWLVLFFVVAAGLSILAMHRNGLVDCTTMVSIPGMHHRLAADHEWDDPACAVGACGNLRSAQEIDADDMPAAGGAPAVYSGSSTPGSERANSPDKDEHLC